MIPIDDVFHFDVTTHRVDTGAVTDADSAPTFDVFEEDTDTPILSAQSMTKRTSKTGNYRGAITCSAANGFEAGKWYAVIASATVNSVTGKCPAARFRVAPAETSAGVPKVDTSLIEGSDATNQIRDAVVDDATRIDASALNTAAVTTIPAILEDTGTTLQAELDGIQADTEDIQSRLPAALVGGRIDATVDATGMESGAVDAIWDETIGDSTITARQAMKVFIAALAGKLSGAATTTITIRNVADSANVIVATVDADGNRSAVTLTV